MKKYTAYFIFIMISFSFLNGTCNSFSIVKAEVHHDTLAITQVVNQAYAKVPFLKSSAQRTTEAEIAAIIAHPFKTLYLCLDGSRICGTIMLDREHEKPEMGLFAVDSTYKGIGKLLLQHVVHETRSLRMYDYLYLKAIPCLQTKLINYYEQHGFEQTEETELFPQQALCALVKKQYRSEIYFRVMKKKL